METLSLSSPLLVASFALPHCRICSCRLPHGSVAAQLLGYILSYTEWHASHPCTQSKLCQLVQLINGHPSAKTLQTVNCCIFSAAGPEYLQMVLSANAGDTLPAPTLWLLRHAKFRTLADGDYGQLLDDFDRSMVPWLLQFQVRYHPLF